MSVRNMKWVAAALMIALALPVALAQQSDKGNQGNKPPVGKESEFGRMALASRLVGLEIKDVGKIEELVVDSTNGRIAYVVISEAKDDNKFHACPLSTIQIQPGENLEVNASFSGKLDQYPAFDENKWDDAKDSQALMQLDPEKSGKGRESRRPGEGESARESSGSGNYIRYSALMDVDLVNNRNNDVGSIEDFVVNLDNGDLHAAIVSTGGFLGIGENLQVVPWMALRMRGQDTLVVDVNALRRGSSTARFERDRGASESEWATGVMRERHESARRTDRPSEGENVPAGLESGEQVRIPFKLEQGQTYRYELKVNHSGSGMESGSRSGMGEESPTRKPGENPDEKAATGSTGGTSAAGSRTANYEIRCTKVEQDGSATCDVTVSWGGEWSRRGISGRPESDPSKPEQDPSKADQDPSKQGNLAGASGTSRSFTLKVGPDGDIQSLEPKSGTGGGESGSRPQDESRMGDREKAGSEPGASERNLMGNAPLRSSQVRSHLAVIFGEGLHGQSLSTGRTCLPYSRAQLGLQGGSNGENVPAGTTSEGQICFEFVHRTQRMGNEVARFNIFSEDSETVGRPGRTTPDIDGMDEENRPGRTPQGEPGRPHDEHGMPKDDSGKSGMEPGKAPGASDAASQDRMGYATYNLKDGLLEQLIYEPQGSTVRLELSRSHEAGEPGTEKRPQDPNRPADDPNRPKDDSNRPEENR